MKIKSLFLFFVLGLLLATQVRAETTTSTLTVQVGVTYLSEETKPAVNMPVRLLNKKVLPTPITPNEDWKKTTADFYKNIEESTVFKSTTDFLGRAIFEDIPVGIYYVYCDGRVQGGYINFEKSVTVKGKSTFVALSNNDQL